MTLISNIFCSLHFPPCLPRNDDFNNTCKESIGDCNANDVENDENELEQLVAAKLAKCHYPLCVELCVKRGAEGGNILSSCPYSKFGLRKVLLSVIMESPGQRLV